MEKPNYERLSSDLIRGNIDTIILRCLHRGDMYGLEICNLIKEASEGTYIIKQPTLYSALNRLKQRKMVSSYWQDSKLGGRRHYYRLTDLGRESFKDKKEDWTDAKDVIDTLVDGIKRRRPLPEEEIGNHKPEPVVYSGPIVTPYNPFENSDDITTLSIDSPREVIEQPQMITEEPSPQTAEQMSLFNRYLSPGDYAVLAANRAVHATAKSSKIGQYDVEIQPFTKHFGEQREDSKYVFTNRLKFASAAMAAVLVAIALMIAGLVMKSTYTSAETMFITGAYFAVALYLAIYLLLLLLGSDAKALAYSSVKNLLIRVAVMFTVVVAVICINILAGISDVNYPDFLVYLILPIIVVQIVWLEYAFQMMFNRSSMFRDK